MKSMPILSDSHGRVHRNLRIGVTDRCNIRCFYCMPDENLQFAPRKELLTFEEIVRFVRVVAGLGVDRLRITGGEPLVRSQLPSLIGMLAGINGIRDIALTTNGLLLAEQAGALRSAGLRRINISLDALSEETFRRITRRDGLPAVLEGIAAARRAGFSRIRLNAVAIRTITEDEILPLVEFARREQLELRFIEFMPLDGPQLWRSDQVLTGGEIRRRVESEYGPLTHADRCDPSQPAMDYEYSDGKGRIGFINPVSEPFCATCNRLRISAIGEVRNCLFSDVTWDARHCIRSGANDERLETMVRECVAAKKPGHAMDSPEFLRPARPMYELGG